MKRTLGALAILVLMSLVFTGCGDKATVFVAEDDGQTLSIIFNNDATWVAHVRGTYQGISVDLDETAGTYTGDPKKNGNVYLRITKVVNTASLFGAMLAAYSSSGQTSVTITNEQAPLQAIPENEQQTKTITISGGRFTESNGTVYTRR